ncbi:hypothetical protein CISIN_1g037628mg [Citrus sinensis]|uniref:ACT domain-containing protein n=1 Tax=Citrus sinensis TaxID=2711 RepID=A0A067GYG5_CITSI|nr:hypothetical protein CISIN_1g037628mg [Citrus sinensis]
MHFFHFGISYGLDVNMDRVEDVLLHQKLLAVAKDPEKRPAYHIRFIENLCTRTDGNDDQLFVNSISTARPSLDADNEGIVPSQKRQELVPIHEVVFSTVDKPKLLSQLSALLSDIGLNIREAHVFSTTDGYSLDVFVVDGWPVEGSVLSPNVADFAMLWSGYRWFV